MESWQTLEKLEENVYYMDEVSSIQDSLNSFFDELVHRRRADLGASGVLYSDKAAFKINELDGDDQHTISMEQLAQYLNGDTLFSPATGKNIFPEEEKALREKSPYYFWNVKDHGFIIRVVTDYAGSNTLFFTFYSDSGEEPSLFQLNVIEECVKHIKLLIQDHVFLDAFFGFQLNLPGGHKEMVHAIDIGEMEEYIQSQREKHKTLS